MASTAKSGPPTAKISDSIANFGPARKFGSSAAANATSLDFDDTGELALVAQDDETLQIYNCKEGKHAKELKSQKYGVDLACFSHHTSIIYASTKVDDAIRYLSSHDNSYIRYFRGHTAPVTCITLNPASDDFLSASIDGTVRIWDLRSQSSQGHLNIHAPSLVAYDPTASVIGIACAAAQSVLLYDARNYDKSPFASFELRDIEISCAKALAGRPGSVAATEMAAVGGIPNDWTKLEFSNDGKKVLVASNGAGHYVLDAFDGNLIAFCAKPQGPTNRLSWSSLSELRSRQSAGAAAGMSASGQGDACFSPDGRYVISGSGDHGLYAWDLDGKEPGEPTLERILKPSIDLSNKEAGSASLVAYNPRHNLLVTADKAVVFWLPEMD